VYFFIFCIHQKLYFRFIHTIILGMTLKKKIIFFIVGVGLAFSFLFFLSNHLTIHHSGDEQKAIFVSKVASRSVQAVENEKKRITTLCYDWAVWDAMYSYSEKPSMEFEAESLPRGVVPESDLSLVLIMNRNRQVVYHEGFDQERGVFIKFKLQDEGTQTLWKGLMSSFSRPESESIVVETEFGPLIAISAPILHSDGKGPANGRVVMGRLAEQSFREKISTSIQEKTTLLASGRLPAELAEAELDRLLEKNYFFKEDRQFLLVYSLFRNPAGQPVFAIRIDADKKLFSIQEKAARNFLIALLLSTLLAGAIFYRFIDRMLLQRLLRISKKTRQIVTFADLSTRINEERDDEISHLSNHIDKMLTRLENENIRHQEMEQRLVMNEKLVATGRLAANIAHEINNPLFAISNALTLIKNQVKNASSDIAEVLPLAEKEIRRVRKITKKLLEYGKVNLETFKESDIEAILDTACEVLKLGKQIRNTVIARNEKKAGRPIFCNPDSLQQVFMNLILNASEAMGGKGEIDIAVERSGHDYKIHFRDSGPGFPDANKQRIFEPFNSSKETKGAGLGLYISYHIVKKHGGSMRLDETAASGAHMVISLPRRGGMENA